MTPPARLLVRAPRAVQAMALRRSLRPLLGPDTVARSRTSAGEAGATAVLAAGLVRPVADGVASGDVVVASEIRGPAGTAALPGATLLAGELRRAGFTVHTGPLAAAGRVLGRAERARLAAAGVLAADRRSAPLVTPGARGPSAVVGVVLGRAGPAEAVRALRALTALGPVLARWAGALGPRRILLPAPRSFCAGVERAIEIVEQALERHGAPVFVRKQIVHNQHVVDDLAARGAVFVEELDEVPVGARLVFSAHGVSPAVRADADRRGLRVVDATCPLVTKVHAEARRFTRDPAATVLFVGHAGHEETEGTLGEAPDRIVLVETVADAHRVVVDDPARVNYLMQTTLSMDEAGEIVDVLRARFPALRGPGSDDICYATTNRQTALRGVAAAAELVLVIGSANSSNSLRLVETARRGGAAAHLVEDAGHVRLKWLDGVGRVGVTAGASAPPHLVDQLVAALGGLGPTTVAEHTTAVETVRFTLPGAAAHR